MKQFLFLIFLILKLTIYSQSKKVTITIDDMPFNGISKTVSLKEINRINSKLLTKINLEKTPVTAFINGKTSVYQMIKLKKGLKFYKNG